MPPSEASVPGAHFRYLRWAAVGIGVVAIATGIAVAFMPATQLSREDGFLELTSCFFWFLATIAAAATYFRWRQRADRLTAIWMACIALLAFLRELDAHVYLNPEHAGQFGVRYRIDWWLDGNVSLWLKLGWLSGALVLLAVLLYIPWTVRLPLFQMARRGEAMVGLFFLAISLLGTGFVLDDLLRSSRLISRGAKKIVEETAELSGAGVFFASAWLRWRFPLGACVQAAGLPIPERFR